MLVQKYIIQGYEDPMHMYGAFEYEEFFVKEYQMAIAIKQGEVVYVVHAEKPRSNYATSYSGNNKEHDITEVQVPDEFIAECHGMLEMQKKIKQMKRSAYQHYLKSKTPEEIKEAEYQYHLSLFKECYDNCESEKAVNIYHQYLEGSVKDSDKKTVALFLCGAYRRMGNVELQQKYKKIGQECILGSS